MLSETYLPTTLAVLIRRKHFAEITLFLENNAIHEAGALYFNSTFFLILSPFPLPTFRRNHFLLVIHDLSTNARPILIQHPLSLSVSFLPPESLLIFLTSFPTYFAVYFLNTFLIKCEKRFCLNFIYFI